MARLSPLLWLLVGCGSARPPPPPTPGITVGLVRPLAAAVARYGTAEGAPSAHGAALRRRIAAAAAQAAKAAGRSPPALWPPLSAAAEAVAASGDGQAPDPAAVAFAAAHFGVVAPVPIVLQVAGDAADDQLVGRLRKSLGEAVRRGRFNRIGVGVAPAPNGRVVIIFLQEAQVTLTPVARRLPAAGSAPLEGRLGGGYQAAEVHVTGVDGAVRTLHKAKDGRFSATLRCGAVGRHQVEVMGTGPLGPAVLANFPVWCGATPPTQHAIKKGAGSKMSAEVAERALFDRINRARAAHSLPAVQWSDRLAEVARRHSHDMRKGGFVGHVSPRTGGPGDRMKRAGIIAGIVMENVGVAPTPDEVHAGLMNSPGHRAAILSPKVTGVGVGVVRRARGSTADYFATELFSGPFEKVAAEPARQKLTEALLSRARGRREDPGLSAVAQSLAADIAAGRLNPQKANGVTGARLKARKVRVVTLLALVGVGPDPASLANDKAVGRRDMPRVGVGVAAGEQRGRPTLFTVVLLAR